MPEIKKILVANRGEIALRVMRTAREMGIKTVAIFSEADRNALHVRYADEAYWIGPPASRDSYLKMDTLLEVALKSHSDAIHPGYGFLSENARFAQLVTEAGIIFIGPSAASIDVMGDKLSAKKAAAVFNIPMVPGINTAITDIAKAKKEASQIGYPVLIKASAGGGGKGMRVVNSEVEFEEQMQRATSEALSSFGNGAVFIEKYITSPKHIEVQVLGDQHGNVVHLFERECSIQRRHQKVIEEAPSSVFNDEKRMAIGQAAVNVAKACNYYGAGTVEFIVDEKLDFYFLEMNTRLQVEHPVTEQITGVDLVREQILIAEGKPLSIKQDELHIAGHSIEVRVYAEDPASGFLPSVGTLNLYSAPKGPGVRVDDAYEEGMEIPIHYDPLIAKLIVHAQDRPAAIQRMLRAIDEYKVSGIETTLAFCRYVLNHDAFISGQFDTKFVERHFSPEMLTVPLSTEEAEIAASVAFQLLTDRQGRIEGPKSSVSDRNSGKWKQRLKG